MRELNGLEVLVRIPRRYWHVMAIVFTVIVTTGVYVILQQPPIFTATSVILLKHISQVDGEATVQNLPDATVRRIGATVASIAQQPTTFDIVRDITGIQISDRALRGKLRTNLVRNTELIEISVSDEDAEQAQILANAVAQALLKRHASLEKHAPTGTVLQIMEEARKPSIASSYPRRARLLFVIIGAAFVSLALAFFIDRLDRRVESEHDVTRELAIPLIGTVETYYKGPTFLVKIQDSYQNIASTVNLLKKEKPKNVLSITGTRPGEGKSYTLANLAIAFRDIGCEVVLIDLDLRRPTLSHLFKTKCPWEGIGPAILKDKPLPAPQTTQYQGITLIPAGEIHPRSAARVYESPRLMELLKYAVPSGDKPRWLLVDFPPLLAAPGVIAAAAVFKNTIFAVRSGLTRIREAQNVLKKMALIDVDVLGGILIGAPYRDRHYARYYSRGSRAKRIKKKGGRD